MSWWGWFFIACLAVGLLVAVVGGLRELCAMSLEHHWGDRLGELCFKERSTRVGWLRSGDDGEWCTVAEPTSVDATIEGLLRWQPEYSHFLRCLNSLEVVHGGPEVTAAEALAFVKHTVEVA
jgi:hypothetical protein